MPLFVCKYYVIWFNGGVHSSEIFDRKLQICGIFTGNRSICGITFEIWLLCKVFFLLFFPYEIWLIYPVFCAMPRTAIRKRCLTRRTALCRLCALAATVRLHAGFDITASLSTLLLCDKVLRGLKRSRSIRFLPGTRDGWVPKPTEWRRLALPMCNEARRRSHTRMSDF